jgi:hypothetical protein
VAPHHYPLRHPLHRSSCYSNYPSSPHHSTPPQTVAPASCPPPQPDSPRSWPHHWPELPPDLQDTEIDCRPQGPHCRQAQLHSHRSSSPHFAPPPALQEAWQRAHSPELPPDLQDTESSSQDLCPEPVPAQASQQEAHLDPLAAGSSAMSPSFQSHPQTYSYPAHAHHSSRAPAQLQRQPTPRVQSSSSTSYTH